MKVYVDLSEIKQIKCLNIPGSILCVCISEDIHEKLTLFKERCRGVHGSALYFQENNTKLVSE